MQGTRLLLPVVIPGTLAANVTIRFTVPCNMSLFEISAVASNDSDATLVVGNSDDADAYLEAAVIGDSAVPVVFDREDFVNDVYPSIAADVVFVATLDFDGSVGTAAQNVTLLFTFMEG